jgi:uncharacterized protein YjiS (DUF1127 family)
VGAALLAGFDPSFNGGQMLSVSTKEGFTMQLQTTLSPGRAVTRQPGRRGANAQHNTALQQLIGLLRRWRERIRARPQLARLCDLDDHILHDIGLTRSELRCDAETPFWR